MKKTLYLIPGLGTNYKIFKNLAPLLKGDFEISYIEYDVPPSPNESIKEYAVRRCASLPEGPKAFLGLSLGGLIAGECAKLFPGSPLVVLSSLKKRSEAPWFLNVGKALPLYKLVSATASRTILGNLAGLGGVPKGEARDEYKAILAELPDEHFAWARQAAVHFDNHNPVDDLLHIVGTRDHVFSHKRMDNPDVVLKNATHYAVMDRAPEIAQSVNAYLHRRGW
jgi:surfactin synthase thioesterase subunit